MRGIVRPAAAASRYVEGAGPAAAFLILGPFAVAAPERLRSGQTIGAEGAPRTFSSVFFSEAAANIALGL